MARSVIFACALGVSVAVGVATAEDAKPAVGDAAFKDKIEMCAACHGPAGVSRMEGVPSLAGEPDFFTEYQLLYFRGETRKNEQMIPLAEALADDDIRNLGAYFATLPGPPAPTDPDPDPALTEAGAQLVKDRHCAQCHLDTFVGQGEIARLAGEQQFLVGEVITLADLMAIPQIYYFKQLPEGAAQLAELPALAAWANRMEERQSLQVTKPPGF